MQNVMLALAMLLAVASVPAEAQTTNQRYAAARKQLVEHFVKGAGVKDPRVLQAILDTPRHEFVPFKLRDQAYYDMALPIGDKQTISSPF